MPRIPLYNKGQGPAAQLATGQLSPRADVGAFTAPGQASARLGKAASDIAFQFGMAERDREDNRLKDENFARAYRELGTHVIQDSSTSVEEAEAAFKKASDKIIQDIDGAGYSSRRANLIKGHVSKVILEKGFNAKQKAHNRGLAQSGVAVDQNVLVGLESLRSSTPGSAQWDFYSDLLTQSVLNATEKGIPTTYSPSAMAAEINKISKNNNRSSVADSIRAAKSKSSLDSIVGSLEGRLDIDAADKDVLRGLADKREGEISNEVVSTLIQAVELENVGEGEFDTVESVESQIKKFRDGDYGNEDLEALWNGLSEPERQAVEAGWDSRLDEARATYNFKQNKREKDEKDINDQVFSDVIGRVRDGGVSPEFIKGLQFVGAEGERLRSQLLVVAQNAITGAPLTTDNLRADNSIRRMVDQNQITSLTQRFTIVGDERPMSILERENFQLTSSRVDEYASFFRNETRRQVGLEEKLITQFLASKELRVRGSSLLVNKPTAASDERMEIFTAFVRQKIREGKGEGKTVEQMLNTLDSKNYIMPNNVITRFVPSKETLLQETKDLLSPRDIVSGISYEEARNQMPSRKDMNLPPDASFEEVRNHPLYRIWEQSIYGIRFKMGVEE